MSESDICLRDAKPADAAEITRIYNGYIRDTIITFEEQPLPEHEVQERIQKVQSAKLPWLVLAQNKTILGYAYAAPWRERTAYRFSVEVSVYLDLEVQQRGLGSRLYQSLFERLQQANVHAALAGIALPNEASIALHEKFGMTKAAHLEQVGFKFGQWIDVGYWQRVF